MINLNTNSVYTTHSALEQATRILLGAFVHLSTNWTNKGFKFQTKTSKQIKTCILGAIDISTMKHLSRHVRDDDPAVIIINSTALEHFHVSAVTVNDDHGYQAVVRLFALAIERSFDDAIRIGPGLGRVEYRTVGVET